MRDNSAMRASFTGEVAFLSIAEALRGRIHG